MAVDPSQVRTQAVAAATAKFGAQRATVYEAMMFGAGSGFGLVDADVLASRAAALDPSTLADDVAFDVVMGAAKQSQAERWQRAAAPGLAAAGVTAADVARVTSMIVNGLFSGGA